MRLGGQGQEICSESIERNIKHKKMGLSEDEGNKDPIYPCLSKSTPPGVQRRRDDDAEAKNRSPSVCLSLAHESPYDISCSSFVAGSHSGTFSPISPEGISIKTYPMARSVSPVYELCRSTTMPPQSKWREIQIAMQHTGNPLWFTPYLYAESGKMA